MAKSHGTHNAPFFSAREVSFPWMEKYRFFYLLVVGRGGPLMLMCFNAWITGGFSIFWVTHLMRFFGVSHRFETLVKCCRVMDSFMLLASFEFSVCVYG